MVLGSNAELRRNLIQAFGGSETQIIYKPVKRQNLVITVTERGTLESASNLDVFNQVEGQTTILWILPEGSQVKKGDKVVELDSATLKDNLTNQEIATRRAKADYEQARKTFEVAEIAVKEYKFGTYEQEKQTIQGEQKLAESELQRARDRLKWSSAMLEKSYISNSQVIADQLAELKAEISKRQAETRMTVLNKYTKKKQETELEANVEKARSDMMAKEQTYQLELTKEEKLKKQIVNCLLYAPGDGLIVYANDANRNRGNNQPQIEEGAVVRERQKIFSLPDINSMQANTKVHESMVDRIEPGLFSQIRVDAFANAKLTGKVKKVAPLPDPSSFFSSDIKVYTTLVTVDQTFSALRPGMSAEVTILIDTLKDVLCIPVTAVLPLQGKDYVYIKTPTGPKRVEVQLGKTNDILIEIKEGVKEDDQVAMNPMSLLSDAERQKASSASSRAEQRNADWGNVKAKSPGEAGAAKGKGKGRGKGAGGAFRKVAPEIRAKLLNPSTPDEQKLDILKNAGLPEGQAQQILDRIKNGGGPGGRGGPGGGGGGFGGGGRGGNGGGGSQ